MPAPPSPPEFYRPKLAFLLFPFGIAAIFIVGIAWMQPLILAIVVPFFALVLTLVATGNSGLILSPEGLEWYALHPRWRFRKVPWHAIVSTRNGFFQLGYAPFGPVLLTVEFGQYERWVWGKPRRDKHATIEIWTRHLVCGKNLWESIERWRNEHENARTPVADALGS